MDSKTAQNLTKFYEEDNNVQKHRALLENGGQIDTNHDERPKSPGCEYDKQYVHGEIGVRKPRFRAEVHAQMFKANSNLSKGELKKLSKHATDVEDHLQSEYQKMSSIDKITKTMINTNLKKHKLMKKSLRNSRKKQRKLL